MQLQRIGVAAAAGLLVLVASGCATKKYVAGEGATLVPLAVRIAEGNVVIRAKHTRYAKPGPDEAQKFVD